MNWYLPYRAKRKAEKMIPKNKTRELPTAKPVDVPTTKPVDVDIHNRDSGMKKADKKPEDN